MRSTRRLTSAVKEARLRREIDKLRARAVIYRAAAIDARREIARLRRMLATWTPPAPEVARPRKASWNRGGENANAKLSADDVERVRARIDLGHSYAAIARSFQVSGKTISVIASGRSWRSGAE